MTIDEAIEKYETLEHENMTAAAEWYQKYLNYQDHEYKDFGRKCDKKAGKYKQLADWLKELKELREQKPIEAKMNNRGWIDFLSKQFDVSRTTAREMLHSLMEWKKEDNFKKQFNPRGET